jgi:hypothetical protein
MKGRDYKAQGRGGTAPLLGQSSLTLPTFAYARNTRVTMHEVLWFYRTANSRSRTGDNHSLTVFGSLDFQTCRLADSPNRPGVKRRSRWVWKPGLRRSGGAILLIA